MTASPVTSAILVGAPPTPIYFTVRAVAAILGCHRSTVYGLIRRGELKVSELAGCRGWRVHEDEVQRHIDGLMYEAGEL